MQPLAFLTRRTQSRGYNIPLGPLQCHRLESQNLRGHLLADLAIPPPLVSQPPCENGFLPHPVCPRGGILSFLKHFGSDSEQREFLD